MITLDTGKGNYDVSFDTDANIIYVNIVGKNKVYTIEGQYLNESLKKQLQDLADLLKPGITGSYFFT